ncbi:hypothetical protein [Tenuifilum osseticum]|uniref:hypothetical protein n=1 Tax=Tenuifilum osseticum TaxID=3374723 RepID=UPI0034E60701
MFSKIFKLLTVSLIVLAPYSCEEMESFIVNCDECYELKPDKIDVRLKFTINNENQVVYFELYSGNPENGVLFFSGNTTISEKVFLLDANSYYSIKAYYTSKGRQIIVIDATTVKLKYDKSSCSSPCYTISGDVLDARLRY